MSESKTQILCGGAVFRRDPARLMVLPLILALAACAAVPPAPPRPREATTVQASFGKTWDAVIDAFGERNIPIRNMERASGFISTESLGAGPSDQSFADCGKAALGTPLWPTQAIYNVIVRGDSTKASVKSTVRFTRLSAPGIFLECSSTGTWETQFEGRIRDRAEGRAVANDVFATTAQCSVADVAEQDGENMIATVHTGAAGSCVRHECKYKGAGYTMSKGAAVARCVADVANAKKE